MPASNDLGSDPEATQALAKGLAAHKAGRLEEAERFYKAVLAAHADNTAALSLLGTLEGQRGEWGGAQICLEKSLAIDPAQPFARNSLGNVFALLLRHEEAIAQFDLAIALKPDQVEAHENKGNALLELRRYEEALASYEKALLAQPQYARAHALRGRALSLMGRYEEALAAYARAITLKPSDADFHHYRLLTLKEMGRLDEALADSEAVMRLDPNRPYFPGEHLSLMTELCLWRGLDAGREALEAGVRENKKVSLAFSFLNLVSSPELQRHCAEIYAKDKLRSSSPPLYGGERYRHDWIRIAYVSADFRNHAVAHAVCGVLERHDRTRFAPIALSLCKRDADPMQRRLAAAFEEFIDVETWSDERIARLLHEKEIDIAVDLMGYTHESRPGIFARRPAPIQVNYLGFPGTMGADFMDYIVADRMVIPEEERRNYSEKAVYLPDSYMPQDSRERRSERSWTRVEAGLPQDGFVFCCFNNPSRLRPESFDIWMRLLKAVPGSVLWLSKPNAWAMRHLIAEASRRGVAADRIVFAPYLESRGDHLARLALADLFLDTWPFGAHSSAADALRAGVPVLTYKGTAFASRVAASLLSATGLPDLIAGSPEEYESLALRFARDGTWRARLKAASREARTASPLFDTPRYTRHLEAAYFAMWERHRRGEMPESFSVPASL